jgi:site-specific recombinase XerD
MDSEWDSQTQTAIDNSELNIALQSLKLAILKAYNKDFCSGKVINKVWLSKVIKTTFMRPKMENGLVSPDYSIYVSDFSSYWLENHSAEWKVSAKKKMEEPAKNQYKKFVETLKEYEEVIGEKLEIRNVTKKNIESFIDWLETENYQTSTIERNIGRLRFFLNRATEMNYEVNQAFKERIYFDLENDIEGVYLNEVEIQKIIDKDFSYDDDLDIVKQNFLIGLFTGQRVSDFLRLDTSNISDGNFTIKSKKTNIKTVIPIHPEVEKIINNNFGCLPRKISSSNFNKHIKTICQVCEIDNVVYGKVFDKDLKRKKTGYFKKYELVTSHICRRSFSTVFASAGTDILNSVQGWSRNSKMSNHYNKKSKLEYANEMKKQWNQ